MSIEYNPNTSDNDDEINNKLHTIEEEDMLENESILIPEDNIVKNDEKEDYNAVENTEE